MKARVRYLFGWNRQEMDSKIISEGIRPDILELLHQGRFDQVLSGIAWEPKKNNGLLGFIKRSKDKNGLPFSYLILRSCLIGTLKPKQYSRISKLNFKKDFLNELTELFRMVLILKDYSMEPHKQELVALTLLECIRDGVVYIGKYANGYPQNSINGKVWIDGAGLRTRAGELSHYFKDKIDDQHTLDALFLKAKLTTTIMNHYPNLVGPDMTEVAFQFEKMGNFEKAKQFFTSVVLDFTTLVQNVEEGLRDPEIGVSDEDFPIVESLISALEGLKRLGEEVEDSVLSNAKAVKEELKKTASVRNKEFDQFH